MNQYRLMTVCLLFAAAACVVAVPPQAVAQREVDIDDEKLEDFVENMADGEGEEDEDLEAELAEAAEDLRDLREETSEVFDGEIREIVEAELPDGIKLLGHLERRAAAPTDEPWEQIERRMRYYETHFHLAGLGEE